MFIERVLVFLKMADLNQNVQYEAKPSARWEGSPKFASEGHANMDRLISGAIF